MAQGKKVGRGGALLLRAPCSWNTAGLDAFGPRRLGPRPTTRPDSQKRELEREREREREKEGETGRAGGRGREGHISFSSASSAPVNWISVAHCYTACCAIVARLPWWKLCSPWQEESSLSKVTSQCWNFSPPSKLCRGQVCSTCTRSCITFKRERERESNPFAQAT